MAAKRTPKEEVRRFILLNLDEHPRDITRFAADYFQISRQAILRHIHHLIDSGLVETEGVTRDRTYKLLPMETFKEAITLTDDLEEDRIWREKLRPHLDDVKKNVVDICQYGFTEIFNNVLDHSRAQSVIVVLEYTFTKIKMIVADDGIGIFKKITTELNLEDEKQAILELAKGKLTTDPERHTGEGIFFTSRAFDEFGIRSGSLFFSHTMNKEDWLFEAGTERAFSGTYVHLEISPFTDRTLRQIFDRFTSENDYGFSRTIVPVFLARYGDENLVSRSQARRLLARVDRFKEVVLDFDSVEQIGQAFADEIFRVFQNENPEILIVPVRANEQVEKMIKRAQAR
jgi:anti-sigma regulatory factor (Ser/Thr protein kinase)